jgi:twitching motility two-component system response regulator PilG
MGNSELAAGARVMVVDDSNTIRRSAQIFLQQAGCEVVLAENGFEALAKVAEQPLDLVFVDLLMPRLDGFQTCAMIRKSPLHRATPIVMLSSKDGIFDRAKARIVGIDRYLAKPFTKSSLVEVVEEARRGTLAQAGNRASSNAAGMSALSASVAMSTRIVSPSTRASTPSTLWPASVGSSSSMPPPFPMIPSAAPRPSPSA